MNAQVMSFQVNNNTNENIGILKQKYQYIFRNVLLTKLKFEKLGNFFLQKCTVKIIWNTFLCVSLICTYDIFCSFLLFSGF